MRAISVGAILFVTAVGCGSSSGGSPADAGGSPEDSGPGSSGSGASSGAPSGSDAAASGSSNGADASSPEASTTDAGTSDAAPAVDASSDAGTPVSMYVTFYGWADNSPPGNAIAYPKGDGYPTVHAGAGGSGTYDDPITFATDEAELAPGTRVYLPFAQKYAMMEDDCVECDSDWASSHKRHIDVWMNSNGTEKTSSLLDCEDQWTMNATAVEVDPPAGITVSAGPLFDPSTNVCRATP